jgi:hypothetical protein
MAKQYVVTGHIATFDTDAGQGRMRVTFYKGQRVPEDAPKDQVEHHLDVNLIAEVPGSEPAGLDSAGQVVVGDQRTDGGKPGEQVPVPTGSLPEADQAAADKAKADAELAEKRAAAKAKLPEGGAMPDGRAGQPVWVEYLVAKGSNYDDVKDVDKAELIELAKQQS